MDQTALNRAEADLCKAIVDAYSQDLDRYDLEGGNLPASIAQAAVSFAMQRVRAGRAAGPQVTPVLERYGQMARDFQVAHGRPPSVGELAKAYGANRTSAYTAIKRLKALNMWPG